MRYFEKHKKEIFFWFRSLVLIALSLELFNYLIFNSFFSSRYFSSNGNLLKEIIQLGIPWGNAALFLLIIKAIPFEKALIYFNLLIGFALIFFSINYGLSYSFAIYFCILFVPLGICTLFFAIFTILKGGLKNIPSWINIFFCIAIAMLCTGIATNAALEIGAVVLPFSYDVYLYKIDAAFFGVATWAAVTQNELPELFKELVLAIYSMLGFMFFPIIALLIRENKIRALNGWKIILVPFAIAWICYAWIPVAGPVYLFQGDFPDAVPMASDIKNSMLVLGSAPRNAMPSMHFSGAIFILMCCAALRKKWLFIISVLFVLGTAWATLALGEHYAIDLIVAMSFAPAIGLFLMNSPRWRLVSKWARYLQRASLLTFLLWMLLLRLSPQWLAENLNCVRLLAVWSIFLGGWLLTLHVRCVWYEEDTNEELLPTELAPKPFILPQLLPVELKGKKWLVGIFFFSGFAGLIYEVVYAKALGVTFGGTALAANTVLMTYMGGMALGTWLGGIVAPRSRQPLLLYALIEAAIGIYAAITPLLFNGIQSLYVTLALDAAPDATWLTCLRIALGAMVLGVPTVLMGATLPLVFQCLHGMGVSTARAIAPLYTANVLGAAIGALIAGYVLLPAVGRNSGTLLAAVISLIVALFVVDKIKREGYEIGESVYKNTPHVNCLPKMERPNARHGVTALVVLTIGGGITLALEVVFMHLLAVVAGNSVYAFGLMLATFLLGLGFGSAISEWLMRRLPRITLVLGAQCGISLTILLTSFVWDGLADYMGSFGYAQQQGLYLSFSAREFVRGVVCALAMLPPAFFIGLSYPAAIGLAADWLAKHRFGGETARGVGTASALNTIGNIAGVLLTGFWWLPSFGSRNVLLGLAIFSVLLAILLAWAITIEENKLRWQWLPIACIGFALFLFPAQWNLTALSTGANVYFYAQNWGEVIAHAESVEGGLTTVAQTKDSKGRQHLTLLTNGKFQGNNSGDGEMIAQESFALIPLMHTTKRGNALVIGYGTGMTSRVLQNQDFVHLDVAETSRDIVAMADKYFSNINANISKHPAVKMHYTDGRNYLLTQSKQYDLISLEISSIWFSGAANLYNREFYELANSRLETGGVLQQWVQMHHMRPKDFLYILGSVRSVFKYVWIYVSGGQGIIVATNSKDSFQNKDAFDKIAKNHPISGLNLSELPEKMIADPSKVDALMVRFDPKLQVFVSTDKNLYLEYATPKGNSLTTDSGLEIINLLRGM